MTSTKANKKGKNQPKFKNILAQPMPDYWPEISEDDTEQLKKHLIELKTQHSDLKNIGFTFGLNECMRKLKTKQFSCILISTEIKPKFIVNQIISLLIANYYPDVRFLCVPNLKSLIGHSIVAIKKEIVPIIENWIIMKSENFPIPEEIIQYHRITNDTTPVKKKELLDPSRSKNQHQNIKTAENVINFQNLYLLRPKENVKQKRSFIPENAKNLKPINFEITSQEKWSDYISFSTKVATEHDLESRECNKMSFDEELKNEKTKLLDALEKMKNMSTQGSDDDQNSKIVGNEQRKRKAPIDSNLNQHKKDKSSIKSPTLKYLPLIVHKIHGNPNKSKKKKKINKK